MAQYNSFPFQQKAIDELVDTFKKLWRTGNDKLELTFKSPTGSGKTFMVTHFVDALNGQPDWVEDVAFVWITFSDELAMQSKEKFDEYFFPNLSNQLLTIQNFNNGVLKDKDILFLNWQKLVAKDAEKRKLRRPEDSNREKEQGYYFEDVVEKTHAEGRSIVMIIDESHKNVSEAAIRDVINPLNPRVIVKVSATPEKEPSPSDIEDLKAGFVRVKREDVVESGLIKEEIVSQTEEDLNQYENKDQDKLLLDLAIEKRNALKAEWKSIGENINPLVLIQLPNDDKKTKDTDVKSKEEIVTEYLTKEKHVSPDKIAYWFDGRKENMEHITDKDNKVEFMLFKYAAGTGWDCPRAHVLVMYREIKSNTFHTQTLGRILRMAVFGKDLSCHPMLRTGYLYTNYPKNEVQNPTDKKTDNKPKTVVSSVNKKQRVKLATSDASIKLVKKVSEKLKGKENAKEKLKEIVTKVVPEITKSAEKALQTSENEKDVLVKGKSIEEQKNLIGNAVRNNVKEVLGDDFDDLLGADLNALTSELIDSVVDNRRDAEFVLDPHLLTDFISRTDYGDVGKASVFQKHFKVSMNQFFEIDANKTYESEEYKNFLEAKGVSTVDVLERDVLVNAHFVLETEKDYGGKDVKYEVSNNDVEKEFSWRCYEILGDQADDETGIGNVARTWGTLKEAVRQWFSEALPEYNLIQCYKVFLNDVNKTENSVFRCAIRKALIDYKPILEDYLKKKRESEEAQKSKPFVLKSKYAFTDDYKTYEPSVLSYVQPFRLPEKYSGRENETAFISYLEANEEKIEWWFKNGTGKDALGFKYMDYQTNKERIFYPDWLIQFKDKRLGIFDTKGGFTAGESEVKDKAEILAARIELLNGKSNIKYVGGIVIRKGDVWMYNDSKEYKSYKTDDHGGWRTFESLLE